jgi:hypothetical protein
MNCIIIIDVLNKRLRLNITRKTTLEKISQTACNALGLNHKLFKIMNQDGIWLNKDYLVSKCHHNNLIYLNLLPRLRGGEMAAENMARSKALAKIQARARGGMTRTAGLKAVSGAGDAEFAAKTSAKAKAANLSYAKKFLLPKNKLGLAAAAAGTAGLLGYSMLKDKTHAGEKAAAETILRQNREKLEAKDKQTTKKMQYGGMATIGILSCSMAVLGGVMIMFSRK